MDLFSVSFTILTSLYTAKLKNHSQYREFGRVLMFSLSSSCSFYSLIPIAAKLNLEFTEDGKSWRSDSETITNFRIIYVYNKRANKSLNQKYSRLENNRNKGRRRYVDQREKVVQEEKTHVEDRDMRVRKGRSLVTDGDEMTTRPLHSPLHTLPRIIIIR